MTTQNFVIGNKTRIYLTILPDSLLDEPTAPNDVTIVADPPGVSGVIAAGAVSIPVVALSGPVPAGTAIPFVWGVAPNQTKISVYTTKSAKQGAIALDVEPTLVDIPDGATGTYTAMLLLVGGTTSDEQIQSNDTETIVYGDELGYSTGLVTKASWNISYSFNVLPSDPGYFRLAYAAKHAVQGVHCWVRKEDPAPSGYSRGESIEGLCDVTDFSKTNPADGIITGKCTFKGRGAPNQKHYA